MKEKLKLQSIFFIAVLFFLPIFSFAKTQVKINAIKVSNLKNHTRIVFSYNSKVKYNIFTLKKPNRLVVDFSNAISNCYNSKINVANTLVSNVRSGKPTSKTLRYVFELKTAVNPTYYVLKPKGNFKYRLVINISPRIKKSLTQVVTPTPLIFLPTKPTKMLSRKTSTRTAIVLIDPGHGGKDPGTTGTLGTHEKNVVLPIAKDLYAILKKQPGIKPYMTRYGDYFVSLRGRLKVARKDHADLFIAIHADAYYDSSAEGATVFALSQHGATSESALWLANRENHSELAGVNLSDKSYLLRSVLIDLSMTATIRQSLYFGNDIKNELAHVTKLHSNIVEQAPFMVLKSPDIPSLLVETGFLSNKNQELKLRNPAFQEKMAEALAKGIENYLRQYPPQKT